MKVEDGAVCGHTSQHSQTSNVETIVGHAIEIVEVSRIKHLLEDSARNFESELFTAVERNTSRSDSNRIQYFAGRLAAKEAVLKVLGRGSHLDISRREIEVQRLATGEPCIILHHQCQEIAARLTITQWFLSISHVSSYAAASAIALSKKLYQQSHNHH
jgi:holo-[acyl-carrier protein] synthase